MVHVFHHCNLFSVIEKSIKGNCIASILWWKFKKFYFETQDKVSRTEYFTQSLIKVDSIVNSLTFSKQIHAPHFILSWEFLFSYYPFQWVSYKHGRSQLLFLVDFFICNGLYKDTTTEQISGNGLYKFPTVPIANKLLLPFPNCVEPANLN